MILFNSLLQNTLNWLNTSSKSESESSLVITGCDAFEWSTILKILLDQKDNSLKNKNLLFIFPNIEEAEQIFECLKDTIPSHNTLYYPGLETSPYSGIIPSERNLYHRFNTYDQIMHSKRPSLVIMTCEAFSLKMPSITFFKENTLRLEVSDIISPINLSKKLVYLGYNSATTVEEPGSFCSKGEIFDIYPISGTPIRVHYFDDMIEEIFEIDLETSKTNRSISFDSVHISPTPNIFSQKEFANNLRENIPMPAPQFREKFEMRKNIFQRLSDNQLFEGYASFTPLFFKETSNISNLFQNNSAITCIFNEVSLSQNNLDFKDLLREEFQAQVDNKSGNQLLPSIEKIYTDYSVDQICSVFKTIKVNNIDVISELVSNDKYKVKMSIERSKNYIHRSINPSGTKPEVIKKSFEFLKTEFLNTGNIIIATQSKSSKKEIEHFFELLEFPSSLLSRIHFISFKISHGFFYETEKILILSDSDLFSIKKSKIKKRSVDLDLFAEQLSTLKSGDYVIHNEHGLGVYQGLESLEVGGSFTDYLVITYKGNDKVYVPVYKMNLIQKHADSSAGLTADTLRSAKFNNLKERAKVSAKKLAFDLLKLQAERQTSNAFSFSRPDHEYREFELSFPFEETPDQKLAIQDVLKSMQKPVPMDHLVCGDVGFGKTEVAMRAAYKAVLDKKQVAVLVPTTVLALQHYNTFVKRFKDFPVHIEFVSRFKTPLQVKVILEDLALGKIDILIGTHKLLSPKIKYLDLGLVVVDEEQRFGVAHKEKLKLLKASVDFLTLTATPIPRTLQLSFLGLREMSLIKTAPPRRQSIKSYLIKQDDQTIQSAIKKELSRGGQIFIVHNRVQDIEQFAADINELVPEAKIIIGHGQLSERELESRMNAFYKGTYQILIATTIIESGIDIPNANTIIINRADRFGLSQLHQLRGRIGRSDRKAYAYFVIPNDRGVSSVAEKRLKALQTYADMGSGFNIATCDMEIRGAGDILGATQSGHIEAIGLELYMELLKEAIFEIKGEKKIFKKDIEINTPFPSYIPNHYIEDSGVRLKNYKRLSNFDSLISLNNLKEEFFDVYGAHPEALVNLFNILETRILLQELGLKSIQAVGKNIILNFEKSILDNNEDLRNSIINFFISRPKIYQFTPDFKVIYSSKTEVTTASMIEFARKITIFE